MKLIAIILLFASCTTTKYYVQKADLKVVKGKPTFIVTGEKKPLTDTVITNIYFITKGKN